MSKRKTNAEFIEESKKLFGDKYDYTLLNYIKNNVKVKLICPIHGEFEIRPNDHLNKRVGCNKCNNAGLAKKNNFSISLIDKFKLVHGEKYNYSLVEYINYDANIKILCKSHGIFLQTPRHHLKGHGCSECVGLKKLTNETFIKKSQNIHGLIYDYSLVNYINNNNNKVDLVCPIHGKFEIRPNDHLNKKVGCSICKESGGENIIRSYLKENNIPFLSQKRFKNCKDKRTLPFDFYLPDYNICIEYDGEQHFKALGHWGGDTGLIDRQKKDKIKNEYCIKNNIHIVRIKYNDNILDELKKNKR